MIGDKPERVNRSDRQHRAATMKAMEKKHGAEYRRHGCHAEVLEGPHFHMRQCHSRNGHGRGRIYCGVHKRYNERRETK